MNIEVIGGILIPFVGTTLGAAGVFFMKKELILQQKELIFQI